jgi:hypothetical protein
MMNFEIKITRHDVKAVCPELNDAECNLILATMQKDEWLAIQINERIQDFADQIRAL